MKCNVCGLDFAEPDDLREHMKSEHPDTGDQTRMADPMDRPEIAHDPIER